MLSNTPTSPPCQSLEFFLTSFPFHTAYQPPETLHIKQLKTGIKCVGNADFLNENGNIVMESFILVRI